MAKKFNKRSRGKQPTGRSKLSGSKQQKILDRKKRYDELEAGKPKSPRVR